MLINLCLVWCGSDVLLILRLKPWLGLSCLPSLPGRDLHRGQEVRGGWLISIANKTLVEQLRGGRSSLGGEVTCLRLRRLLLLLLLFRQWLKERLVFLITLRYKLGSRLVIVLQLSPRREHNAVQVLLRCTLIHCLQKLIILVLIIVWHSEIYWKPLERVFPGIQILSNGPIWP